MASPSRILLVVTLLLLGVPACLNAQHKGVIEARLHSRSSVSGEKVLLSVSVSNATVVGWPDSPLVPNLSIVREGKTNIVRNGYLREVYEYVVTALKPGLYQIPPFSLETSKGTLASNRLNLRVFPITELATKGITIDKSVTPYLTGIFLEKEKAYLGEAQRVEAKLYVSQSRPNLLRLRDGRVITMEKDGLAAWRFTTEPRPSGVLEHDGHTFAVYSYQSSINALRTGKLKIGPGIVEPVFQRRVTMPGGFGIRNSTHKIEFPEREIEIIPLPAGAPDGFAGAVGTFSLNVSAISRQIEFGDTLTIEASIDGTGNIDQFPGPFLVDPEGHWKQFEMIAKPPGDERRTSSGTVEFSQIVRPLKNVPSLPPYRFVYFDPVLARYQTLDTPPQPLTIIGDSLAENANENKTLNFLTPGGRKLKTFKKEELISPWWQLIPAAVLLFILVAIFKNHVARRKISGRPERGFQKELDQVLLNDDDRVEFYREAAKMATRWRAGKGFEEIFETRDKICFLPDKKPESVDHEEKRRITDLLKQLAPLVVVGFITLLQLGNLNALEQNPSKAKAEIEALMESEPAPEHFYNLALCEQALGNPGSAALWAYRYQAQGGDAEELLKNISGIRAIKKEGTDWVAVLPRRLYIQLAVAGGWALVILIVAFKLPASKLRKRLIQTAAFASAIGLSIGLTARHLYPEEISFVPLHHLWVVTESTPLRMQPFEGSEEMRKDLVGSLCKVTAERADWTHVKLPGGLGGWVKGEAVTPIAE